MIQPLTDLLAISEVPMAGSTADHGLLHILSTLNIWSASFALSCLLVNFALPRRKLPAKFIFGLFGALILGCATVNLVDAIVFSLPADRSADVIKSSIALGLWLTIFALIRFTPRAIVLHGLQEKEQEIRARNELEELANAMPQMVWTARSDGYVDYYNDRWYEYTGQQRGLGGDESRKRVLHPDDVQLCVDMWNVSVTAGTRFEVEHRFLELKSGVYRWHLSRALPIKNAEGKILRWIGTCTDIEDQKKAEDKLVCARDELDRRVGERTKELETTNKELRQEVKERRRAEEALAESARFARSTLDALGVHLAILDDTGCILATNKAWREFASANAADVEVGVGANYLDVCDAATGSCAEQAGAVAVGIRAVIRGAQEEFALEYPCHSATAKRWFVARATRFGGDGPVRVVIAHENITAAKLADLERQKFVSLVENSADFIGMATLNQEVVYLNSAARQLVGIDKGSGYAGVHIPDFHTDAGKRILFDACMPTVMATGKWRGELQFRNLRTGQSIDTESSVFMVRHPQTGEPLCLATVTRDITERKRQEEELRQARAQLMDAIESLDAGLVMYGPDERLVICNTKYKELYSACAHAMVPGTPYEEILRVYAESGVPTISGVTAEEWVARRLQSHRHPGEPSIQRLLDRWIRIGDHRTSDGGVVSLRTDITALMQAQETADKAIRARMRPVKSVLERRDRVGGFLSETSLWHISSAT